MPKFTVIKQLEKSKRTRNSKTKQANSGRNASNTVQGLTLAPARISAFIPDNFHAKHKYVEGFVLTGGAAGVLGSQYTYNLNGLYDPYATAGGHQAYGFDQLAPWYNSYCVTDCRVSISASSPTTDSTFLGIAWNSSVGSFTINGLGISDMGEKDNARWVLVPSKPGSAKDTNFDLGNFSIAQLEGKKKTQILVEDDFQGTSGGNPTLKPTLLIAVGELGGAATSVNFVITMEFDTVWRGRKTQAQS